MLTTYVLIPPYVLILPYNQMWPWFILLITWEVRINRLNPCRTNSQGWSFLIKCLGKPAMAKSLKQFAVAESWGGGGGPEAQAASIGHRLLFDHLWSHSHKCQPGWTTLDITFQPYCAVAPQSLDPSPYHIRGGVCPSSSYINWKFHLWEARVSHLNLLVLCLSHWNVKGRGIPQFSQYDKCMY